MQVVNKSRPLCTFQKEFFERSLQSLSNFCESLNKNSDWSHNQKRGSLVFRAIRKNKLISFSPFNPQYLRIKFKTCSKSVYLGSIFKVIRLKAGFYFSLSNTFCNTVLKLSEKQRLSKLLQLLLVVKCLK